jgi:hypothetical protein
VAAAWSLNKNLPALGRNLGRAYLDVKNDPNTALPILQEALNHEPSNSDLQDAYNRASSSLQAYTSCSFSLSGSSAAVTAGAAALTVSFTTATPGCAWNATTYAGWITASTNRAGTGSGSISYVVAANSGLTSRPQALTIAGKPFTITQAGASCSSLPLTSLSATAPPGGGTFYVGVVSPSDACAWSASTVENWISIVAGASGNGGVSLSVTSNAGGLRTGIVTIANQQFTIAQSGPGFSIVQNAAGCFSAVTQQQNHATTRTIAPQVGILRILPFWIGVRPSPAGGGFADEFDIACYTPSTSGSQPDSITLTAVSVAAPGLSSSLRIDRRTGKPK